MNKKIVFIFAIICIIVFLIFYYIFYISGNNIIRNKKELIENVLKTFECYEANIDVKIVSNKNENTYNMHQMVENDESKIIVNSPESVKGLEIKLKDGNLKITNEKTNMQKIYENYKSVINNSLFLNNFIKDYKTNESEIIENEQEIIVKINLKNDNTYIKTKELYINKETKLPTKLLIKDDAQKINTSIIYNDIKIK